MKKLDKQKGFGIAEILIMVGIMAILFSMTASYTRRGGQQITLYKEQAKVVGEIMRARALTTQRVQGTEKICGYGITFINAKEMVLFKNLPTSGNTCTDFNYSGATEDVEKITLDGAVEVTYRNLTSLLFLPPELKVYFDGNLASGEGTITIGIPQQTSRTITINSGGQVVVQ